MEIFKDKKAARAWMRNATHSGCHVGVVPTMGALHEGHYSLVRESQKICDKTVATIFVNPTQFGPNEDLSRYPRTLAEDITGLEAIGTDAVFIPDEGTMYGPLHSTYVLPPDVARGFEGASRPGHFQGVATIVLKLFQILPGTHAFFGQKDFQQAAVIRSMIRDLDLDIQMHVCPIIRDHDGVALSSRNRYLSEEQRERATSLWRSLKAAEHSVLSGERCAASLTDQMRSELISSGVDAIDYATIADPESLVAREWIETPVVAMIAARFGNTRLLDNHIITP